MTIIIPATERSCHRWLVLGLVNNVHRFVHHSLILASLTFVVNLFLQVYLSFFLERPPRVELGTNAWQALILPLNYGRLQNGARRGSRTPNLLDLNQTPLPIGLHGHVTIYKLAEMVGFEPTERFLVRQVSNLLL